MQRERERGREREGNSSGLGMWSGQQGLGGFQAEGRCHFPFHGKVLPANNHLYFVLEIGIRQCQLMVWIQTSMGGYSYLKLQGQHAFSFNVSLVHLSVQNNLPFSKKIFFFFLLLLKIISNSILFRCNYNIRDRLHDRHSCLNFILV